MEELKEEVCTCDCEKCEDCENISETIPFWEYKVQFMFEDGTEADNISGQFPQYPTEESGALKLTFSIPNDASAGAFLHYLMCGANITQVNIYRPSGENGAVVLTTSHSILSVRGWSLSGNEIEIAFNTEMSVILGNDLAYGENKENESNNN